MFIFRWVGWNMATHYTFYTFYGRLCYSFIKHDTQKLQCLMNFKVDIVFSICHVLFYLTNTFTVVRFWQSCFQSHIGCGITFTTIVWAFWQTLCVSTWFCFLKDRYKRVLPRPYKVDMGANIGWANLAPQHVLSFCPKLSLEVFDP